MSLMITNYFKHRSRFNFLPNTFEIGRPLFQNKKLEDNFFLLRLYELKQDHYGEYYRFHLNEFLKNYPLQEEAFFTHVRDLTINRIKYFKRTDPFAGKYVTNMRSATILENFYQYLQSVDKWHTSKPIEAVINEKDELIKQLKGQVKQLEEQVKAYHKYEPSEKIAINKGSLPVFIDIVLQLQELTLPNEHKLVRSQTQSPWYKMISRYFMHGENEIPIDTVRNYFPANKSEQSAKFITIDNKDKVYRIQPTATK
ncbi:MAG: hypothetical protein EOO89_22115 [Pedobacter sp.]|nr:MAG: hypothetical protein EOO89_22115 [Pedobacter sp.]